VLSQTLTSLFQAANDHCIFIRRERGKARCWKIDILYDGAFHAVPSALVPADSAGCIRVTGKTRQWDTSWEDELTNDLFYKKNLVALLCACPPPA
jgi:hypothetical protein